MIAAINTVIILHHTKLEKPTSSFMIRTFKIYSLGNLQICNTELWTTITILYIATQWCIYFITGSLYLLTPFIPFPTRNALPSGNHHSILCIWVLFCFSDSTYKWDCLVFVCISFISLNIIPSRSIYVIENGRILSFLWLRVLYIVYAPFSLSTMDT